MKYWILTSEYPPVHGGGIATYCLYTAQMLAEKGWDVTVFTQNHQVKNIQVSENNGIRLVQFAPGLTKEENNLGYEVQLSLDFAYVVESFLHKESAPDVLETQEYMGIGYYTLFRKKLQYPGYEHIKMVVTMHAPSFLYFEYNRTPYYRLPEYWWGEMEKAVMNMADVLISPSDFLVDELEKRMSFNGPKPVRIVNPYPVKALQDIEPIRQGDLVFFGKLTPQKGCLELFSYMKELWDNGFEHPLRIVGGGSHYFYPEACEMEVFLKRKYKTYIAAGKVVFEGNVPPDRLPERLQQAQVIIVPSIVDNLPYVVIEAMGMGKTVLASMNSGHTELIEHGVNGFLFDHLLKGDFAEKLKQLLTLTENDRQQIGKQAHATISTQLAFERVFEQKAALLENNTIERAVFPFNTEIQLNTDELVEQPVVQGKLSIVIPFYNLGSTLEETLRSLVNSEYANKEIIVVDDGSDDAESVQELNRLAQIYPVKIIRKQNEGLSLARNTGAHAADGEFLAFLDADDTVEPRYYTKAIAVLQCYENVSFVGCWAKYFGENNAVWPTFNPEPPYLLVHNMINSSALIYKRNHFVSFGLNNADMVYGMEDYDSVISMVKNGARGIALPEKWWNYRIRKNSMQQSFNQDKQLYLYRQLAFRHENLYQQFARDVALLLNNNGPGMQFDNPTKAVEGASFFSGGWQRIVKHKFKQYPVLFKMGKRVYKMIGK